MPTASPIISMPPPERRRLLPVPFVLGTALAWALTAQAAPPVVLERIEPRLFGYQLGDVISQQVTLRLAPGVQFDPQSLPRAGKRAGWFMVRGSEVHSDALPDGGTQVSLTLDMQLVNSPTTARTLTVPAVALRFKAAQAISETIPSLTIDAVPLDSGEVRTGLPDVRAARPAPLIDTRPEQHQLQLLGVAALALSVWLVLTLLWRVLRPRELSPFAAAQRDLRRLLRAASSGEGARAAMQRLHRAFDQAAGQRLFGAGVPAFCHRMGADSDLEQRTVAFFSTSQSLFFDTGDTSVPEGLVRELGELCRAWQRFEGRHA
jgi:mxaA protein